MPGWAKALIGTLGVVVALVMGALVVGIVYVARNKDAWRAQGREVQAQGKSFGANSDNQGCLDESIARYKKDPGFLKANSTNNFMLSCLESSRPTPGLLRQSARRRHDEVGRVARNAMPALRSRARSKLQVVSLLSRADVLWRAETKGKLAVIRPRMNSDQRR